MRQPLKPFSVETRQSGRRKLRPAASAPRDLFIGTDPDGSRTESYDAALRAADLLFGGGSTPQPTGIAEPPAADAPLADYNPTSTPPRAQGRILRAIEEPVPERSEPAARPAARRGRPPGSKNKIARVPTARAVEREAPLVRPDRTADELVASLFGTMEAVEPAFIPRPTPIVMPSGAPRLRFSWVSKALGPGERWKRRLPRVCW